MLRETTKAIAEACAARGGPAAALRWVNRRNARVLAYHNIVPDDAPRLGDRSLHLRRKQFARQLDWLCATHDIVPLNSLIAGSTVRSRPAIAITFDDAYRGALTIGIAELAQRRLPSTFFVSPKLLGNGACWWDAFSSPHGSGLDPQLRSVALDELRGRTELILSHASENGIPSVQLPGYAVPATLSELQDAATSPQVVVGAHTWSHANLTRLGNRDLDEELRRPIRWLSERLPRTISWLAYPYGLNSPAVRAAARAAGYTAALTLEPDWVTATSSLHSLPRLNVPAGISHNGFIAAVSGVRLTRR